MFVFQQTNIQRRGGHYNTLYAYNTKNAFKKKMASKYKSDIFLCGTCISMLRQEQMNIQCFQTTWKKEKTSTL